MIDDLPPSCQTDFDIRDVTTGDLDEICTVFAFSLWPGLLDDHAPEGRRRIEELRRSGRPLWRETFDDMAVRADPRERFRAAFAKEAMAGFILYGPHDPYAFYEETLGEIHSLFVHPRHWGRGAAARLFNEAASGLRKSGFDRMMLTTYYNDPRPNAFYRKMGGIADFDNVRPIREDGRLGIDYYFDLR